ncbi:hypothetical protein KP509_09G096900 [Ceratopteris richardii]|uniref:t-SNARE coiled-coil homology domain-containing protein n=1 Tax=Ceratopteris richardii TaxID=49495 RepID=A0A8T2U2N4_CERRI|nr:hypothetical protein KP509_09G096900 [Ceratopteris richardii]
MNNLLSRSFNGSASQTDLEAGVELSGGATMARFQGDISALEAEMEKMKDLLNQLQRSSEDSRAATSNQAMKSVRQRMDSLVMEVLRKAKVIKGKLEALERSNQDSRKIAGCEAGSTLDRMRTNVTATQRLKLQSLTQSFDELRQRLQAEHKDTVKRRYHAVTGVEATEEMVEEMIASGESETFLQKAVREQGRGQILGTVEEIRERHDALKEMERNLLELHQIFLDMGVLVEEQGLKIKTIEEAVGDAQVYVMDGTNQLVKARKTQKNTRKWTCICIIILLIIIILVVVLLVKLLN